jgi:hypothetical protein
LPLEIFSRNSEFAFNGDRYYIHGPTILEVFRKSALEAAGVSEGAVLVKKFMINELVSSNGVVKVYRAQNNADLKINTPFLAEMSCTINKENYLVGLFDGELAQVKRRDASLEKQFIASTRLDSPFSGVCGLSKITSNSDLVQAVVEANKQVNLLSVPKLHDGTDPKFRFVYCLKYACPAEVPAPNGVVHVSNIGIRDFDDYNYILNNLDLNLGDWKTTFQICFATTSPLEYPLSEP